MGLRGVRRRRSSGLSGHKTERDIEYGEDVAFLVARRKAAVLERQILTQRAGTYHRSPRVIRRGRFINWWQTEDCCNSGGSRECTSYRAVLIWSKTPSGKSHFR